MSSERPCDFPASGNGKKRKNTVRHHIEKIKMQREICDNINTCRCFLFFFFCFFFVCLFVYFSPPSPKSTIVTILKATKKNNKVAKSCASVRSTVTRKEKKIGQAKWCYRKIIYHVDAGLHTKNNAPLNLTIRAKTKSLFHCRKEQAHDACKCPNLYCKSRIVSTLQITSQFP